MSTEPTVIVPSAPTYEVLLTGDTAISHHDPAVQDDSNRLLFNRQKQLLSEGGGGPMPTQEQIDTIVSLEPVPVSAADLLRDLSFPEFVATALARLFMDLYNSQDGAGLFAGMERYSRLEARLRQAAIAAPNLRRWWDRLVDSMQVGIHGGEHDAELLSLLTVPAGLQQLVLRSLAEDYRSIVALARLWHSEAKLSSEDYAAKVGRPQVREAVILSWQADELQGVAVGAQVAEVPAVSANSLRHQLVRKPLRDHLWQHLGIQAAWPGKGLVPPGVEAIFENGGNIEAGAKQPSNVHGLAWRIREAYPVLDLLGGVTDSFDLGESRLKVAGWLVCRENREALRGSPAYDYPAASVSVFDMLDDVTHTRQASGAGEGQMIYSFETLCTGAQILCRLTLSPHTPRLSHGALQAALKWYLDRQVVGGQSARGFGWMRAEALRIPENCDGQEASEYEAYLAEHREELLQGLIDGTLCSGARVLT
jgi:hypothetical protein